MHVKTIFGRYMDFNQFPPPATDLEKAQWNPDPIDVDDNVMSSSPSLMEDADPAFPYPDGPGHREAMPATLSIIWNDMRRHGVVSFSPDFTKGPQEADNIFLWDLAHCTFIKLVCAGEYSEIDLACTPEDQICVEILNHAKQLQRT